MVRSGRDKSKNTTVAKSEAQIVDKRPLEKLLPLSQEPGKVDVPIRTVLYVEVGNMPSSEARSLTKSILANYDAAHPHYVIFLRNGSLQGDVEFQKGFLDVVNELCVIKNKQIVLKNEDPEMVVVRRKM